MYSWSSYSPEAHKGLGLMYVGDERFTSYYEQHGAGFAEALNAIIQTTLKQKVRHQSKRLMTHFLFLQ